MLTGETQSPAVQGTAVGQARGIDLALENTEEVEITAELPGGGVNTVRARIVSLGAFICIKALLLDERKKQKDAYDIYFCLK